MTTVAQWFSAVADLPRTDCELLLADIAGISRARLLAFPQDLLGATVYVQLQRAAEQLRAGIPLAYVVGHQAFWDLDLQVTPDVLIPRPDTELLVELVLELAPPDARILELGTGSGAIAIAIATTRPDLQVTATDRSAKALAVAKSNAVRHQQQRPSDEHITFVAADWFDNDWFANKAASWQIIVANPPYIACDDEHLPALAAEPRQALVAGQDGLVDLRRIIAGAPHYLLPGGLLIVEHGYDQAAQVREMMTQANFSQVRSAKDLAHIERATLGCWQDG